MDERGGRPYRMDVALLGTLRVCCAGVVVALPGARLRGLLVRLALGAGRPVDGGALVEALWPQARPADPVNALQSLVSRLRRVLGSADAVEQVAGGYRLAVGDDDVDAVSFERLAGEGRVRLRAGDPAAASILLTRALALWRGPVAVEVTTVAPTTMVRLAQGGTEAAADLAEADLLLGRHQEVAARLPALLTEQPLHERLAGLLMDALAGQGRQAEALAVYERIRRDLAEELGADPGAALRERHLRVLRAGPAPTRSDPNGGPPDHARVRPGPDDGASAGGSDHGSAGGAPDPDGALPPGNLPAPLTSFVGRDEDLARIDALLGAGRLVTVLGPGGAGKTRLALEAAGRHRASYRDGTWLVDLSPVTEPAEVAAAIVSALGLRGTALFEQRPTRGLPDGRGVLDVLIERLASYESLLVIDNCEHLVESVAQATMALLVRCPRLRVLATSREPLAIDGEALVPLAPLELPPADADVGRAAGTAAVRLFVERAAAVRPGFAVDAATVRDVVQVVRRLDGLPLALELAAARLRTLPLAELAAGLSDRFRLLTGGSRTALPRHRTLRAVIAWSWDLLGADERIVAERVAVLPAGVTPASAAAVGAGTGIGADRMPDLLGALVDRSLLQLAGEGPRYRMLETLREYGIERLVERDELTAVRDLAAGYVAALVAQTDPLLRTADQMPALRLLHAEYDNALAALRHLCDSGDGPAAVRLALDLCWYWQMFGRHAEAVFWLREACQSPGDHDPVRLDCASAVQALNALSIDRGASTESPKERQVRFRELATRLGGHEVIPGFVGVLTSVLLLLGGDAEGAGARLDQIVTGDDVWLSALARLFRARIAENAGDVGQVRRDVAAALVGFHAVGDRWGQATALPVRALTRQYDGDLDGALADLRDARALSREFGSLDVNDEIFLDLRWADLHLRRGEPDEVDAAIAAARATAERSGSPEIAIIVDALEAGMLTRRGDLDRAEWLLNRAERRTSREGRPSIGGDHGTAILGVIRAALAEARGEFSTAEEALIRAYAAAVTTEDMPILSLVGVGAAGLALARGQHRDAASLLGAAGRLRGAEDPTDVRIADLTRRTRAVLGPAGFADAYAAGWSLDAATALARVHPGQLTGATTVPADEARLP